LSLCRCNRGCNQPFDAVLGVLSNVISVVKHDIDAVSRKKVVLVFEIRVLHVVLD
jgi:hypothetical protein